MPTTPIMNVGIAMMKATRKSFVRCLASFCKMSREREVMLGGVYMEAFIGVGKSRMMRILRFCDGMYVMLHMSITLIIGVKDMRPKDSRRLFAVAGQSLQGEECKIS